MTRELTADVVVDGSVPSAPALSPDGRRVVFVVEERSVSALWVVAPDGSAPPRRLVAGTAPRWAPDSETIFFHADRDGAAQLHRIRISGGEAEALTTWAGGICGHLPLADPCLVAVLAADEPTAEDLRRAKERDDARVWGERVRPVRLRLLDVRTGEIHTPAAFGDRHVIEVVQRPNSGRLAVLTCAVGVLWPELHVLDLDSETVRDLGPAAVDASSLAWWHSETGWRLTYLATPPPGLVGGRAAFVVEAPGEHRDLTAGMTACPLELVQVASGAPLVLFADGLDTTIRRLGPHSVELSRVDGLAESLTTNRHGDVVAVLASTSPEPMNVYSGPPAGPLARLSDTRPELRDIQWGIQKRLSYLAPDGLMLDGLLILPPGAAQGPFPLITLVHGGPYGRHADRLMLGWYPSGQWLAAAGYAVFLPNPRGGQGHGHEFAASVAGAVGIGEWTDIVTGIDLLIADGVADPERLGIGGWSHGGFMAAWAVGHTDRFKAALVGAGISDWGMLAATGEYGPFEAALAGSTGWEGPGPHPHDLLSPISFASKIHTPILILHGEEDTNVPVSQAEFLHRALRRFGVEHQYVVYPRETHAIRERTHQLDLLRRTRDWFDRWLT